MMVTCEICRKSLASNFLMCPIMNQSAVKLGVLPVKPVRRRFLPCRRIVAMALYQQVGAAVGVDVGGHSCGCVVTAYPFPPLVTITLPETAVE